MISIPKRWVLDRWELYIEKLGYGWIEGWLDDGWIQVDASLRYARDGRLKDVADEK